MQVEVSPLEEASIGDVLDLSVLQPDGTTTVVSSAVPTSWDGQSPITVSVPAFAQGDYQVSATITDSTGDTSEHSNIEAFNLNVEDISA